MISIKDFDLIPVTDVTNLPEFSGVYKLIVNCFFLIAYNDNKEKCIMVYRRTKSIQYNASEKVAKIIISRGGYPVNEYQQLKCVYLPID